MPATPVFTSLSSARPVPRHRGPGRPPAWPSLTESDPLPAGRPDARETREPAPASSALRFDEDELAAVAASVAWIWSRQARADTLRALAARQTEALERAAAALVEVARAQRDVDARARGQIMDLVAAIARALALESGDSRIASNLEALLRGAPETTSACIVVEPLAAEALRAHLPAVAARAGFRGSLEVAGDPRLAPGTVQLFWPDGWSEHVPAHIHERIMEILAAHAPPPEGRPTPIASRAVEVIENGSSHAHD
ncbi:hypothetical protein [Benzoatithermus flavus]|uniref:FliH/SctL family protein n=1 Tax=Benzoatithermus flavus TaxID=3108223 RepID=A0ABU8XS35_9PROT